MPVSSKWPIGRLVYCLKCHVNTIIFSVDGHWSKWSEWGQCDSKCGDGLQLRRRTCTEPAPSDGGMPCAGESTESMPCWNGICSKGNDALFLCLLTASTKDMSAKNNGILSGDFVTKVKQISSLSDLIWISNFCGPVYLTMRSYDINIRTVINLFSIRLPSIQTPKSSSDEPLWYLWSLHLILPRDFTSELTF